MSWIKLIFFSLLFLYLIIIISPVRLNILIKHTTKQSDIVVGVRLFWGLIRYNIDIPKLFIKNKKLQMEAEMERSHKKPYFDMHKSFGFKKEIVALLINELKNLKKMSRVLMKLSKRWVKIEKLSWHTDFGTSDAANTGIMYGVLWQLKTAVLGFAVKVAKMNKPIISVEPKFNKSDFNTKLNCIITFPLGYIITVGIYLLFNFIKTKIKYLRGVNFVRSSNSRANENRYGKH
ncbi:DUF2953 domain-containing protein [Proteinivorax tanatarense]|uniref:DUF2953 domain-containing protein n=1 Tax=Proteinivorax tanatarense TaxID=1260629 RepID=A0AAU7VQ54_9FIRM